jgi:predicted esterase
MLRTIVTLTSITTISSILIVGTAGCRRNEDSGFASTTTRSSPLPTTAAAAAAPPTTEPTKDNNKIETLKVPNDRDVFYVPAEDRSNSKRPIIHLHGMCTEPKSDLDAFSKSVNNYGTVIALVGDKACGANANEAATWAMDPVALDARIKTAIEAVRTQAHVELDPHDPILIGESMGASRAVMLANKFPDRYQRLVLVGAPEAPSPTALSKAKAVSVLVGEKEQQAVFEKSKKVLSSQNANARFWVLPGAVHGDYGKDGARIMSDAVAFVSAAAEK